MRKEKRIRDEKRGGEQRRSRLFFQTGRVKGSAGCCSVTSYIKR